MRQPDNSPCYQKKRTNNKKPLLYNLELSRKGDIMSRKKNIGILLKSLRGERSQGEVAANIGISVSALSMYEQGERTPKDEIKMKIAEYFGKTVQEIFFS